MQHDDRVYLRHMLEMSRKARELASSRSRVDFDQDEVFRLALRHLIQIVGEAASQVSAEFRSAHAEIPWGEIMGMRHRVVHDYLGIDEEIVWSTVVQDLPQLIQILERQLPD